MGIPVNVRFYLCLDGRHFFRDPSSTPAALLILLSSSGAQQPAVGWRTGAMTKTSTASNKTLHLTGIGLAVQAFYINLTLDTVMGGEFVQLKPAGPPVIKPAGVWSVDQTPDGYTASGSHVAPQGYVAAGSNLALNGLQALQAFGGNKIDANGYRDQNGYYRDNNGALNGYDVGNTYGGQYTYLPSLVHWPVFLKLCSVEPRDSA